MTGLQKIQCTKSFFKEKDSEGKRYTRKEISSRHFDTFKIQCMIYLCHIGNKGLKNMEKFVFLENNGKPINDEYKLASSRPKAGSRSQLY